MTVARIDFIAMRWVAVAAGVLTFSLAANADTFVDGSYDPGKDELVVTMLYRGTNPDHEFSLRWGECQKLDGSDINEVVAEVLDNQYRDGAEKEFTKTVHFPLDDLNCPRPTKVTLRSAPRFLMTLFVPPASATAATAASTPGDSSSTGGPLVARPR